MKPRCALTEKGERDFRLVRKALEQNDEKAVSDLFQQYRNTLYYLLYKMTNNPLEAEELIIETFRKAYGNLHNYTPEYSFRTWLFKIATNGCIDYLKAKSKQPVSPGINGDVIFEAEKKSAELLQKIIGQLKPKYRKVIELRYFKEYSIEEIEKTLQIPVGTIKAQLSRGKEMLFNTLNRQREWLY